MQRGAARVLSTLLALLVCLLCSSALGHSVESASLSVREVSAGRFLVRFQANSPTLQAELLSPAVFPAPCQLAREYLDCGPAGLSGTIEFPWLSGSMTRVMVDIEWLDHTRLLRIISESAPTLTVYGIPAQGKLRDLRPIVVDYTRLGIEHILTGLDHLLFVIALTFLVRGRRALLATITAFTLAHSLSLAATVLGLVRLASAPVEASIALSIAFVCAECLRPADSLAKRAPWLVAFSFGLLHGLGFASALLAIGLPEHHLPLALLFFNIGVELGQLATIACALSLAALAKPVYSARAWLRVGVIYALGTIAAGWSLDRIAAVIGR